MNINSANIENQNNIKNNYNAKSQQTAKNDDVKFSDELKEAENTKEAKNIETDELKEAENTKEAKNVETDELKEAENTKEAKNVEADELKETEKTKTAETDAQKESNSAIVKKDCETDKQTKETRDVKQIGSDDINFKKFEDNKINEAIDDLSTVFKQFNNEKYNEKEDNDLINNECNISDKKQITPQMNPSMNFSGDNQPFSSFMQDNQNEQHNQNGILGNSQAELDEEAKILSTMAENIKIANKNTENRTQQDELEPVAEDNNAQLVQDDKSREKTVNRNDGIRKVDVKSGVTIETVVKYDNIIMNEADVEVFANLVQNEEVNLNDLNSKNVSQSAQISKTLADMLAKAKETNQPLRIDFDNDISVIIKISRDGKLSADFLPSSQVAETYLKENLPLLKQRFDENNIEYDELNQRNSRERDKENNKRKENNNE